MSDERVARRQNHEDANPKIDPGSVSNTVKEPDDWVSGDDPMTGAQASYLKTLSEELGEPEACASDMTKAEASKMIDALKTKRNSKRDRGASSELRAASSAN